MQCEVLEGLVDKGVMGREEGIEDVTIDNLKRILSGMERYQVLLVVGCHSQ